MDYNEKELVRKILVLNDEQIAEVEKEYGNLEEITVEDAKKIIWEYDGVSNPEDIDFGEPHEIYYSVWEEVEYEPSDEEIFEREHGLHFSTSYDREMFYSGMSWRDFI